MKTQWPWQRRIRTVLQEVQQDQVAARQDRANNREILGAVRDTVADLTSATRRLETVLQQYDEPPDLPPPIEPVG